MPRLTGKDLYVAWIDAQGTAALQADFKVFEYDNEIDSADLSAGSDSNRVWGETLGDLSFNLEMMYNSDNVGTAAAALYGRIAAGNSGTLVWGPEGTASGKPKGSCYVFVSKHSHAQPFDDGVTRSIEFKPKGTWSNPDTHVW